MRSLSGQRVLFKAYHGSYLYGLSTPNSDKDFKGIVIPTKEELKKNSAPKTCYNLSVPKKKHEKNQVGDVDTEFFTLKAFIRLCAEGQTSALEMLFTPKELWVESSPEWEFIYSHRHLLIHKKMGSFFHLARKQAYKYSVKGERIEANKKVIEWANQFPDNDRIISQYESLQKLIKENESLVDNENNPLIAFVICEGPKKEPVEHLLVSNRKNPLTATFKHLKKGLIETLNKYGHRALMANEHNGADFKALSHAVRVGYEAVELLTDHKMTFPMTQREELLAMKTGKVSFDQIEEKINFLLNEITRLSATTTLPEGIDEAFWNNFVEDLYDKTKLNPVLYQLKKLIKKIKA